MKKVSIFIVCFLFINNVYGSTTIQKGTFSKCVDGDTAYFIVDKEEIKFRFLAIDTPETVSTNVSDEPFGKEASDFTCNKLTNAKEIVFEYESSKTDKYGRTLAWIWVDGSLLQKEIIENGYGKVAYIYGNYKYTDSLCLYENKAIENKLNVWSQGIEDGGYKQGYCTKVSLDNIKDNIVYDEIEKSLNMTEKADDTIKKLEKIDDKITSSLDENSDKIESILLYVIIALGLIVTIIKETKKK